MKNLFIVLDGMDGTGKTTQISLLHDYLFRTFRNAHILTTREPTSGRYGSEIRQILAHHKDPYSERENLISLYIKDRKEHIGTTVLPFLSVKDGNLRIVLCDRYYYSTIAYQAAQGGDAGHLMAINRDFPKPDLAIILDIDPKQALVRIQGHRSEEKFESLEFMEKVRKNFAGLTDILSDRLVVIESSGSVKRTSECVVRECRKLWEAC